MLVFCQDLRRGGRRECLPAYRFESGESEIFSSTLWEKIFMARITVEDCLEKVASRFELVVLASKRAKQLLKGAKPLLETDNREVVTALREIAAGKVRRARSDLEVALRPAPKKALISPQTGEKGV
jgi:DNA-directed RNA polymerase subunit omega